MIRLLFKKLYSKLFHPTTRFIDIQKLVPIFTLTSQTNTRLVMSLEYRFSPKNRRRRIRCKLTIDTSLHSS